MALKGKWQISQDYPTTLFAKDGGNYRITSSDENQSDVTVKHRITNYFYDEKAMKKFRDNLETNSLLIGIPASSNFRAKKSENSLTFWQCSTIFEGTKYSLK